ncbi:hemolysin A [Thermodesulfatator indicus DSM 15286]|uniref:Hemolysin A n=1 Tax=Thermodesulfatator indicus (strain DSM 15286 / JCM 11887 / CIR29812) TaxID=667014 RepID=F8ACE0_THEID|nr:TlyA family RNA methyltransferase [Thermodesulfatator indicus]AEH44641.1 hemolysin A [Thermodesulfatator indicus DSM 15286]
MSKERLDKLLVKRGLVESREKAQAMIMAGQVYVNGERVDKAGHKVPVEADIQIKGRLPFVSRGGLKLAHALTHFGLNVKGLVCADIGASTGGFTDCLLQAGAQKVYAIDVGKGQLHYKLRSDPRVVVFEEVNARYLTEKDLPEPVDLITIDVSFISLTKILPAALRILKPGGKIVALIKPQFEVGRNKVGRGGVVRDPALHQEAIKKIEDFATKELNLKSYGVIESPILGPAGNKEFLILLAKTDS